MERKINWRVSNDGVLHVYRDKELVLTSEDWLGAPKSEIEDFIKENIDGQEND